GSCLGGKGRGGREAAVEGRAPRLRLTGYSIAVGRVGSDWQGPVRPGGHPFVSHRDWRAARPGRAAPRNGVETMAVDLSMPILVVDDYNTMICIIPNFLQQQGLEETDQPPGGTAAG